MRSRFIGVLFVLCSLASVVEAAPKVDLYTMGVGDDVFERFGHAALCLRYPESPRQDICYNYGTTNFSDPAGLGWNFLRGRAQFWVSLAKPDLMLDLYIRRDRTVWVQELPITPAQATAIEKKLHFDSQKENRFYVYHHYFDNCTTRIRDVLDENLDGVLSDQSSSGFGATYRDLTRSGFADSSGLLILSDYVLGRIGDKEPTDYEAMFLPSVLRDAVRTRMGAEPVEVYTRQAPPIPTIPGHARLYMLIFSLLLIAPIWVAHRRGHVSRGSMVPAVLFLTLAGTLLWALAVLSPLPMARFNESMLLFIPADLAILFLSEARRQRYCQARVAIVLLATIAAMIGVLHQPLWAMAPIPLLALLPTALGRARSDR